jgi:hypothetical protein
MPKLSDIIAEKSPQDFIAEIAPIAIEEAKRTGIPPSLTIAQAALESEWGKKNTGDFNVFGIKGIGPAGARTVPTSEFVGGRKKTVKDQFRSYTSLQEAVADHNRLLQSPAYQRVQLANTPQEMARELTGLYATDPKYGQKVASIIDKHNLTQFDASAEPSLSNILSSEEEGTSLSDIIRGVQPTLENLQVPSEQQQPEKGKDVSTGLIELVTGKPPGPGFGLGRGAAQVLEDISTPVITAVTHPKETLKGLWEGTKEIVSEAGTALAVSAEDLRSMPAEIEAFDDVRQQAGLNTAVRAWGQSPQKRSKNSPKI